MKPNLRPLLLEILREKNVIKVEASYSGYGDSGNVDYLQLSPPVDTSEILGTIPHPWKEGEFMPRTLNNALCDFVWSVAYNNNPGFENNDGGQGEIVWDITADKITLDHSYNITESISEPTVEL